MIVKLYKIQFNVNSKLLINRYLGSINDMSEP